MWHPHPQNQRPNTKVESNASAKNIAPAFTTPFLTNSIPSDGSIGVSVTPPNQPYFFPKSQITTCKIINACTAYNTIQRALYFVATFRIETCFVFFQVCGKTNPKKGPCNVLFLPGQWTVSLRIPVHGPFLFQTKVWSMARNETHLFCFCFNVFQFMSLPKWLKDPPPPTPTHPPAPCGQTL